MKKVTLEGTQNGNIKFAEKGNSVITVGCLAYKSGLKIFVRACRQILVVCLAPKRVL